MIPLTLCLALAAAAAFADPGSAALFTWADFDGDQLLDLAAVDPQGRLQLLANTGDGRFEDITERFGVADVENAALALWADYDTDGRLDLFVGAREGISHLFHNDGEVFVDVGAASGLASKGPVLSAHWLDHDGDGRLDLHVVTAEANELYHGLGGGFFEVTVLPAFVAPLEGVRPLTEHEAPEPGTPPAPAPSPGASGADETRERRVPPRDPRTGALPAVQGPTITSASLPPINILGCSNAIKDQAGVSSCLQASTTPTLGMLYPLSANLFVAVSGNVGIGTTSPAAKLDVAGTARITDTLTLAPSGDQALNVSTGSLYKAGALFIHTKGGTGNTALGRNALTSVTTGFSNTASGYLALNSNTTGGANTATGDVALYSNTTGGNNTASGSAALFYNTTGNGNTASGVAALWANTTGSDNTASGYRALYSNTTGFGNTASGVAALRANTTGNHNTASGYRALYSNTTGLGNTASGDRALRFNTTGSRNMASGYQALYSNTTGRYNTASGYRALFSNTSGFFNIALGQNAALQAFVWVAGESGGRHRPSVAPLGAREARPAAGVACRG